MLDVLVIGSGPAGLAAAIYAKRANRRVLVAEKVFGGTGQIAESNLVENYPGFAGINGYELGEKFREHALCLGVEFLETDAQKFQFQNGSGTKEASIPGTSGTDSASMGHWRVTTKEGAVLETKTVIYAAGAIHRRLGITGEQKFANRGVSYCAACDGAFFKGKPTAVIGGGDTALDDALYLSNISSKVYLIHRRDAFRGFAGTVEKLRAKENVEFVLGAAPAEIVGTDRVQILRLMDGRELDVAGVFIAIGMVPNTNMLKDVVELDPNGYIIGDETGKTSADGFFAAGDVRTKSLRQVVTAVADGANAATSADQYMKGF